MNNQRVTRQKKIIMEALMHADHPTATELYAQVSETNPTISRGTVFRVLAQYAENGEILKLDLGGGQMRFDARLAPHAHAKCLVCGRVEDVYPQDINDIPQAILPEGFEVRSINLSLYGVCNNCKNKVN